MKNSNPATFTQRRKFLNKTGHGRIVTSLHCDAYGLDATLDIADCSRTIHLDTSVYLGLKNFKQNDKNVRDRLEKLQLLEAEIAHLRISIEAGYDYWKSVTAPKLLAEQAAKDKPKSLRSLLASHHSDEFVEVDS